MKTIGRLLLVALMFCTAVQAQDAKPTEDSIRQLLEASDVKKLLDGMMGQIDGMVSAMTKQALQGKQLSAEQQNAMSELQTKMLNMMKEEFDWKKLEPVYIKIYRDSFDQSEVDGMLAFYTSPAGKAVVKKMPLVMQNSVIAMQERMMPMMQRMQKMTMETVAELQKQNSSGH